MLICKGYNVNLMINLDGCRNASLCNVWYLCAYYIQLNLIDTVSGPIKYLPAVPVKVSLFYLNFMKNHKLDKLVAGSTTICVEIPYFIVK